MIVACTSCGSRFRVADHKIGPRGARLRCTRCQTVFVVRRDEAVEEPPPPTAPPPRAPPPRATSAAAFDARASLDIDLEPPTIPPAAGPAPSPLPEPFGSLSDDPFGGPPPLPPARPPATDSSSDPDPFGLAPPVDPFAAVQAPVPPELLRAPPAADALGRDLALEEITGPPGRGRTQAAPTPPRPDPAIDPFSAAAFDPGALRPGTHADEPLLLATEPPEAAAPGAVPSPPRPPAPVREDPFAAAAVDADPLHVAPRTPPAPAPAPPLAAGPLPAVPPAAPVGARVRTVAVNAVSLLALLVLAMAILVVWRGRVPLGDAFRPAAVVRALVAGGRAAGPVEVIGVTSGLYDRGGGRPVLFVKGTLRSTAATALGGVVADVELLRGDAVVARRRVPAGAVLDPEALAADGAGALDRASAAAAARAPAELRPGEALPFLVAFDDYPDATWELSLRVSAAGGVR